MYIFLEEKKNKNLENWLTYNTQIRKPAYLSGHSELSMSFGSFLLDSWSKY